MKTICNTVLLVTMAIGPVLAQEICMTPDSLKELDASWEKAQLELDYDHIASLLADDYIWVHNHAITIDDKAAVLDRVERYRKDPSKNAIGRNSRDVSVIISGTTGLVSGYTVVEKRDKSTTYHFMRTYVEIDGKCHLLANHTMALPENE